MYYIAQAMLNTLCFAMVIKEVQHMNGNQKPLFTKTIIMPIFYKEKQKRGQALRWR